MKSQTESAIDSRVRRAARKIGLQVVKSRRGLSLDNYGEYMLLDPYFNSVVAGQRYDLTAEDVIAYCTETD
jgi:hypothetical protein